jgi:hypothetical protein
MGCTAPRPAHKILRMKTPFAVLIAAAAVSLAACAARPTETKEVELTAKNAVYLQRLGYKIVNKDGETLICSRNATTGTMIQKTTTCLTEQQWAQVEAENRRTIDNFKVGSRKPADAGGT